MWFSNEKWSLSLKMCDWRSCLNKPSKRTSISDVPRGGITIESVGITENGALNLRSDFTVNSVVFRMWSFFPCYDSFGLSTEFQRYENDLGVSSSKGSWKCTLISVSNSTAA